MRTFLLVWPLIFACSLVWADSAKDVEPLSDEEFIAAFKEYPIKLTAEDRELALGCAQKMPDSSKETRDPLIDKLREPTAALFFVEVAELMQDEGARPLVAKLTENDDPLLRFLANLVLAGAGDSAAAECVYDLIHDEDLTHPQKQWLSTWSRGIGIDVKTDTAATIFEHLRTVMGSEPKYKPGDAAPAFEVKDVTGKTWSLEKLAGRFVVLHFWATNCGPCMGEMHILKEELAIYSPLQVEILFVSLDSDREIIDKALEELELPFHQVFDGAGWGGELARAFGVNSMPSNVIIDGKGIVRSLDLADLPTFVGATSE